ncbi:MAG: hypothetical protein ACUVR0_11315 [Candidatus Aminicenantales bacterium]
MIFFFVIGAALFDFSFESRSSLFLAYYFIFFWIYIHPLSALLVCSFLACLVVWSIKNRPTTRNVMAMCGRWAAGLLHWFYYLLFKTKPVSRGTWERNGFVPSSKISLRYLAGVLNNFWLTFKNIFSYEFICFHGIALAGKTRDVLFLMNEFVIYFSLAVFVISLILVLKKIWPWLRKKDEIRAGEWPYLFFFFRLGCVLNKVLLFYPPHQEPRHNFDLLFLSMMSYLIALSRLLKGTPIRSWKIIVVMLFLLALCFLHGYYFWQNAQLKDASYAELMSVLSENRVKSLTTDFIIAYASIIFLRGKT